MKYIFKKLCTLIITLFIVSLLAFYAFALIGDPTTSMLGTNATPEQVAALQQELGLDRPVLVRYGEWLLLFLQGDMGTSYSYHMSVASMVGPKLPITAVLTLMAFVLTVVVSIPLGIATARREGGWFDKCMTVIDQIVMSVPPFFIGILLTVVFGLILHVFQPGSFDEAKGDPLSFFMYMIFPALSIAMPRIAMTVKMLRSPILDQMGQDYIRTARSKGVKESVVIMKHALKNAMIPIVTLVGTELGNMLTGSMLIEKVFSIPGIGKLAVDAMSNRDLPLLQGTVVYIALVFVIVNLVVDLSYALIDPRIRYGKGEG